MNEKKLLTIIIPSYNMAAYLEKTIRCLFKENNYSDLLDIIIVNDGSKDNTLDIARTLRKEHPSIINVLDKENGNYGSCINIGLKKAKGMFVKILDADDSFEASAFCAYLKHLVSISEKNDDVDLIITDGYIVDENDNITGYLTSHLCNEMCPVDLKASKDKELIKRITHHFVTYRTSRLIELRYEQIERVSYSDQEWVCLPYLNVRKYVFLPIRLYKYLVGRTGQSMSVFSKNLVHQLIIKKHLIDFYKKTDYYSNKTFVFEIITGYIVSAYRHYLIENRRTSNINELIEFDSYLKENNTSFYNSSSQGVISKHFKYKFVKKWRSRHNSFALKMSIAIWNSISFFKSKIRGKK